MPFEKKNKKKITLNVYAGCCTLVLGGLTTLKSNCIIGEPMYRYDLKWESNPLLLI